MSDAKFKVGDKVVVLFGGYPERDVKVTTVERVMKRFVELDGGSRFNSCGSDTWPASDNRFRVRWARIEPFDAVKHQPLLAKQDARAVREKLLRKLEAADAERLVRVVSEMRALLSKLEETTNV